MWDYRTGQHLRYLKETPARPAWTACLEEEGGGVDDIPLAELCWDSGCVYACVSDEKESRVMCWDWIGGKRDGVVVQPSGRGRRKGREGVGIEKMRLERVGEDGLLEEGFEVWGITRLID